MEKNLRQVLVPLCLTLPLLMAAQDGVPDLSWGVNGRAQVGYRPFAPKTPKGIAFDHLGRLVVAGEVGSSLKDVFAVRFLPNGSPDLTFGAEGGCNGIFCTSNDVAQDVAVGPDGSVYICGTEIWGTTVPSPAVVLKWDPNGTLDENFGPQGCHTYQADLKCRAYRMAIQPDGKVIVAADRATPAVGSSLFHRAVFYRLNTDGTYDDTFGGAGIIEPIAPDLFSIPYALALQPDGKLLAMIQVGTSSVASNMRLMRFMPDGTVDGSFGVDGTFQFPLNNTDVSVLLDPQGRLVVFFFNGTGSGMGHRMCRLLSHGEYDPSYGNGGCVDGILQGGHDRAMLPDGRVLMTRISQLGQIYCYSTEGSLDTDFGIGGLAQPPAQFNQPAWLLATGPDQRFAATTQAPNSASNSQPDVAAYMFLADSMANMTTGFSTGAVHPLTLFPSPCTGSDLFVHGGGSFDAVHLEVWDAMGRVLCVARLPTSPLHTPVNIGRSVDGLPSGIYHIAFVDAYGERTIERVVLSR